MWFVVCWVLGVLSFWSTIFEFLFLLLLLMAAFVLCDQKLCYAMYTMMMFTQPAVQQSKPYAIPHHTKRCLDTGRLQDP